MSSNFDSDFKTVFVDGTSLPDLWFQTVYAALKYGKYQTIDKGSFEGSLIKRIELPYFFGISKCPWVGSGTKEVLPDIPAHWGVPNPVEFEYIYGGPGFDRSYIEYIMTDRKEPGEDYTYGERLVPQIEEIIYRYRKFGPRNNQLVLQVARPEDLYLDDPPCLRQIDTKIEDDGTLVFHIYFRSWDLWSGFPANLAGIEALHQYMANEIGVRQGHFTVQSKGLHLYDYVEPLASVISPKGE